MSDAIGTYARIILDHLAQHAVIGDDGQYVKRGDLVRATGLNPGQVMHGVNRLRDEMAQLSEWAFVSKKGPNGGIGITKRRRTGEDYLERRLGEHIKSTTRLVTGSLTPLTDQTSDPLQRQALEIMLESFRRAVEDMERARNLALLDGSSA